MEAIESPASAAQPAASEGFDRQFELQGIGFRVSSPNNATNNSVTVVPTGLETDNSPWESSVDGDVVGAEIDDLDANGSPEIYVYVRSRVPLYSGEGDAAVPTGRVRQLQYRLTAGEAGWQLELVGSSEF